MSGMSVSQRAVLDLIDERGPSDFHAILQVGASGATTKSIVAKGWATVGVVKGVRMWTITEQGSAALAAENTLSVKQET